MIDRVPEAPEWDTWEEAEAADQLERPETIEACVRDILAIAPASGLVLDLGTGPARVAIGMLKENVNFQIIATDTSLHRLKVASTNISEADLDHKAWIRHITPDALPFPDATFDCVVSNRFMHRLPNPAPLVRELHRVCKPGAAVLVRDWLRPEGPEELALRVHECAPGFDERQNRILGRGFLAAFTVPEAGLFFRSAGFTKLAVSRKGTHRWQAERRCGTL